MAYWLLNAIDSAAVMGPKILGPEAFAEGQSTEVQSFRWSLTLISKMLIRVITEGTVGHRGDRGAPGVVPWNYVELLVPSSRGRLNSCYESHQYQSRSRAEEGTIYGSGGTGGM